MQTELDKVMDWYQINLDCQKAMKIIIRKNPESIPLQSLLVTKEVKETTKLLDKSISELNDLTIVSLVSIFEQTMLDLLRNYIHFQLYSNDNLTKNISRYTLRQFERGRFSEIIELFKPIVDSQLIGMVKQVYEYRNWVAHGKQPEKTPSKIDPISAYERLSDFLSKVTFNPSYKVVN